VTAVLQAQGLSVGYGPNPVVHELDLTVRPGEVVALLGPNGAGKTTTVLALAGVLGCMGGEVLLHGVPNRQPLHHRVRKGLGLVTEQRAVLMSMTVAENLRVNRGDVALALELFPELYDHLDRRVGLLSGGQQQMLALARALSRRPSVLLADELSLGLAPIIVDRLLAAVRSAADTGTGVLLVEQHVHKTLTIADRAYVLQRGRVVLDGAAGEMVDRLGEVERSYLAAR
jgi:branched-chain amino acid transport system ATP-binding protein